MEQTTGSTTDDAGTGAEEPRVQRLRADDPDRVPLEARIIGAGRHVETVVDVGRAPNGDLLLLLPRLPARLADLLGTAGWPTAGEAVTVLVPLLEALEGLHRLGVAHGGVGPRAVRFDPAGAPVWCGFDHAVLRRSGAAVFGAAVEQDRTAALVLATGVLRATGGRGAGLADALDRDADANARGSDAAGLDLPTVVAALYDFAEPVPVRLHPTEPVPALTPAIPGRVGGEAGTPAPDAMPARLGKALPAPLGKALPLVRSAVARLRAASATVRPRVWALAAASVVLFAAASVLLPGRGADAAGAPPSAPAHAPVIVRSSAPAFTRAATPAPHASPASGRAAAASRQLAPRSWSPERAAAALLAARSRCLAGRTTRCLAAVDAPGSPVDGADRAALAADVAAVLPEGGTPRLVSLDADAAVLDVHGVTVLAVREPGGWRLRDVAAEPPA